MKTLGPLAGARVLVVDDHVDLVENLAEILEDVGATVMQATSARKALEVGQQGFDVALVDIQLPDATGLALLGQLRQLNPQASEVLLITGNTSLDAAIAAVGQSAYAYLLKPFNSVHLLATVGRALEKVGLERERDELERKARVTEKLAAVGTLSAGLAHEIRNPLNAASLQLQLLERRITRAAEPDQLLEPVGLVRAEIARLSHLVDEFLLFARPADLQLRRFDLGALVARIVDLQLPEALRLGIQLDVDRPADPIHVDGDRDKLQQVIVNLVRNAFEALAPTGGNLRLMLDRVDRQVRLRVRDDGPGIPEPIRSRIFEPFFSTKPMGTGLGMPICHSLIQQHGGALTVDVEGGTTVEIRLPAARSQP